MKFTLYFEAMKQRPDRSNIRIEWIELAVNHPVKEVVQQDGRIRRWAKIAKMNGGISCYIAARWRNCYNAFFDRSFTL